MSKLARSGGKGFFDRRWLKYYGKRQPKVKKESPPRKTLDQVLAEYRREKVTGERNDARSN